MRSKRFKLLLIVLSFVLAVSGAVPGGSAAANAQDVTPLKTTAAAWPAVFSPYAAADGSGLFDPAGDEHPIDVDITSGVDRGIGALPSMYVASDGEHYFVRLRLKGDPYDRKGGFLSSVWLVQIAAGGVHEATIGLNGKSPSTDYVYVANADGSDVQAIYATSADPVDGRTVVPGTRVVPAENGQYFLDFQVPIASILAAGGSLQADTDVQLFFGTSKAANLSVINKEHMDTAASGGTQVSFAGLSAMKLTEQPLAVSIDGGTSKAYSASNKRMTGTSSIASGSVTLTINGEQVATPAVVDHVWTYELPTGVTGTNGVYQATVEVASDGMTAEARQDVMMNGNTDSLTIDGGPKAVTGSKTPTISGTYSTTQNNFKVYLYVRETEGGPATSIETNSKTAGIWKAAAVTLPNPSDGKTYWLRVEWVLNGQNTLIAAVEQRLTYEEGSAVEPVAVGIHPINPAGEATPVISGTSSGADRVEVRIDGVSTEFVTPGPDGAWTIAALERPLASGSRTVTAVASNADGNTAAATAAHSVSETVITIDNGASVTTNDNRPTVRGTTNAADHSTVSVTIGSAGPHTATVQNGRWSVSIPGGDPVIADGAHTVTATVTGLSGVSAAQQLTIDSGTMVTVASPADASTTMDKTPTFQGAVEENDSIALKLQSNGAVVWTKMLTAAGEPDDDNSTDWSYTPEADLALGDYTLTVVAADAYGNEAYAETNFTVSDTAPAPSLAVDKAIIAEAAANDGSVTETQTVTLTNGTFAETVAEADVTFVPGLPAGLGYTVARTGPAQLTIAFTGSAASHADADDVAGVRVKVAQAAVTGATGDVTSGSAFAIDFANPADPAPAPSLAVDKAIIAEAAANDGSVTETQTVTLTNGTFAETVAEADVTFVPGLPAGLGYTVARTGPAQLTIAFTGSAASHADADDVAGVRVKVAQAAVTGATGDLTSGSAFAIDFANPADPGVTPLRLQSLIPADDAVGVARDTNLTLTFDAAVVAAQGKRLFLKRAGDDSVVETFLVDGDRVAVAGDVVTVDPAATLAVETSYYVEAEAGAFRNASGGESEAIAGKTAWNFATAPMKRLHLLLTANPDKIAGDGRSTTELSAVLTDPATNEPVQGVEVVFAAPEGVGVFRGGNRADTDATGRAKVVYQSAKMTGTAAQQYAITANVRDEARGLSAEDDVTVTFQPAVIEGVVTEGTTNKPVEGALVKAMLDLNGDDKIEEGVDFIATATTGANGKYAIPVPKGEATYALEITRSMAIGGTPTPVTYKQEAVLGETAGQGETYQSEEAVTGIVLFKQPDGEPSLLNGAMAAKTKVYLKDGAGRYIAEGGRPKAYELGAQGVFSAVGLGVGDYKLEIRYELQPGREVIVGTGDVSVKDNGEMNIAQELVDPYGTITDAGTGELIEGAEVTLYYADTARNRGKGNTPHTPVTLPALVGFEPNDNESPTQYSDEHGFYAYMVYPESDYYLIVKKDGYYTYTSPVLSVEWEIVRHDLRLSRLSAGGGFYLPPKPDMDLTLSADRNLVEEGDHVVVTIAYKNASTFAGDAGELTVSLPEGAKVVDAGGGKAEGGKLVWRIGQVAPGATGSVSFVLRLPQLTERETGLEIRSRLSGDGEADDAQTVSLRLRAFSDRFGTLAHPRYILGYPDGRFMPNRTLNRAELAAIVARLTEEDGEVEPADFRDVPDGYWAAGYIVVAVKQGYFTGFEDGTFRPDAPISRGELAVVMARFLKSETGRPIERQFADTENHWAGDAIEALYRGAYLSGYPDGTFRPDNRMNRAEAVTLINRMLYRGPLEGLAPLFPDMPDDHWAFGDVQEATVSHESVRNADGSEAWRGEREDDTKRRV